MVFVSEGQDGTPRLFTRRLDQANVSRLPGTEGAYAPFFAPDGKWIGFFAQGKLKKTRIDGGEPVSLCDAPSARGASWGEDGDIIAALDSQAGLFRVPSGGGNPIPITTLAQGEDSHRWPHILPGGNAVIFNVSTVAINFDVAGIAVLSLKDHQRKAVLERTGMYPRYLTSGHLAYVTKGNLFAVPFDSNRLAVQGPATRLEEVATDTSRGFAQVDFSPSGILAFRSGGNEGLSTFQWLDSSGKTEAIGLEAARYSYPRLSPDGARLAYVATQGSNSDLWIYDLQRSIKTRLTNGRVIRCPLWSSDGRFVVFEAIEGMFWVQSDGAGVPQQLTQSKTRQWPSSFGPNGTRLVYTEMTPAARGEIRILPMDSKSGQMRAGEPQPFLKTSSVMTFAAFSPDGKWLAYANAESGPYEVYVRAFPDRGSQVAISNAGGTMPTWSRHGHELFYRTEDQQIMVANYTVKGESFIPGRPRLWVGNRLANVGLAHNLDLAPDGKRFIVLMPAESTEAREKRSHVTLVINYFDEIRRRVAAPSK
jgi:serine/threonine-protein kinase